MQQISKNVFVESKYPQCNLGLITTSEGIVIVDVPQIALDVPKWREEIQKKGEIRFVVNTEEHGDHCQNSCWFPGLLITSAETRRKIAQTPARTIIEKAKKMYPDAAKLMDSFKVRLADITFTDEMNFYLGGLTFNLFPLVGHSTGGIGVYIPEEKVVFTTDCVFHKVKTWLQEALPDRWFASLKRLENMDIETIVPGHGEMCTKSYLEEQAEIVQKWVQVVQDAIKKGLTEEEAIASITCPDPYQKQASIPVSEAEINRRSISRLYKLYSNVKGSN
jgi:cyclase